ncbi:MAG TPA: alpha/beta fold hydrolase [Acidimicrobiales bacterium]|nr:alpha/beta fold hydrolase [Acidimicrobiales bacterium]
MVPDRVVIDSRRMRFAVSGNEDAAGPEGPGTPPVWAVNVHGYFAGGGMYWRESAHLAATFGWRVLNPSLPGFAGSDPLPWEQVNIHQITDQLVQLLDHVGAVQAIMLGHSMGGAVAVEFAARHPERALGIVYRDGAATPAWRDRRGPIVRLLGPMLPDVASVGDLMMSAVLDIPDLLIGRRLASTMRGLWPDARRNIRSMNRTLPVGAMLMAIDLRAELQQVVAEGIPLLGVWGCFDRICNPATAAEFTELTGRPVQWVPGGHSWMLPRPQGQADVLRYLPSGRAFLAEVAERRRHLVGLDEPAGARATMRVLRG